MTNFQAAILLVGSVALAYSTIKRAIRRNPPHLRGRTPVDCGEGLMVGDDVQSKMGWDPVRRVSTMRHWLGSGWCPLDEFDDAVRPPSERDFHNWMDEHSIQTPTVFEYEALRENWRRNQMAPRPTPAENARRYAAEGGTW